MAIPWYSPACPTTKPSQANESQSRVDQLNESATLAFFRLDGGEDVNMRRGTTTTAACEEECALQGLLKCHSCLDLPYLTEFLKHQFLNTECKHMLLLL